jgi:Ca-activated chloride channel family protein
MQRLRQKRARLRIAHLGLLAVVFLLLLISWSHEGSAQSGALIPSTSDKPDSATLSLQVMKVDVLIDNQHARVRVLQIFDSHVAQALEGKYLFALLPQASVSDFAIWEGDMRIPGVMMEKRRANAVYSQIKQQQVDPGLLQHDDDHEGTSAFSAKVFPIPAYGTKRIEMEYTEVLPVESLASHFTFPLKPSFGDPQRVAEFSLHLHVLSDYPISRLAPGTDSYPLRVTKSEANEFEGEFQATALELKDDFAFDYHINVPESALSWIAYRAPEQISAYDLRDPALAARNPDGYFEARAIFNQRGNAERDAQQPRNVVLLLDTSLSMYGEKLKRAVEALDYFLHSLKPDDRFDLVLFNEEPTALSATPLSASAENVERALDFIKNSTLGGGTDLRKALTKSIELANAFPKGEHSIVLVSDANPTLGTRNLKQIVAALTSGGAPAARVFAFGLGSDANGALLEALAKSGHGYFARARETEDIATALKLFFEHVGRSSIENLHLTPAQQDNLYQIYASGDYSFDGSSLAFVGRYKQPTPQTSVSVQGYYGTEAINLSRNVSLPEFADTHEHLPRIWARARVDALLSEMDTNGEREDYIAEIIRLSEKYKFVTPYTAFIAAPRALLRPRLIQPGDPVLRVKTDASIASVFAVLPFGETLPLKFLPTEGVWEVRFFAPAWMPDGTYRCRLLLTDKNGNGYQEEKSFVIDSHAPKLTPKIESQTVRAGDDVLLRVDADSDTARLVARMYGAQPVQLFWSGKEQTNIGKLRVPPGLAAGRYTVTISAEDFAHNQSSAEVQIEVLPR